LPAETFFSELAQRENTFEAPGLDSRIDQRNLISSTVLEYT
jgi:hypothetical protein